MSQDDTLDRAAPSAGKVAPESATLRAQPRAVTRLNRRTLVILVGGLSAAVFGATIWSLQPQRRSADEQTELYNVDRVSKSEGLDGLPADYSEAAAASARVGAAAAGRPRPCHRELAAAGRGCLRGSRPRSQRRFAQGGGSRCGFVGVLPFGGQGRARRHGGAGETGCAWWCKRARGLRSPRCRAGVGGGSLPTQPPYRTGKTRKRRS